MDHIISEKLDEILVLLKNKKIQGWIDIKKASIYSGVSISTLRRNIKIGSLKTSRYRGKILFRVNDLDNWLNG